MLKLLGSGGMGVVYQALDRELGEDIALKVLRAPARLAAAGSIAEMQRRFRAELVLARKVTHKHVIRIHDIGEIDGIKFISMPLVKGKDLAAILASGPLPVDRALRYARQIVGGLMAVHAAGVVHRDLKPSNVMVGDDDQVLLMDFGIARSNAPGSQQRTIAGAIVGTTAYMAPEQARGEAVDQRTDVYGFGLILYEMLCGIRSNLTIAELLARMKAPPPSPRQLNLAVPSELDAIVMRCLKPAAGDRYQTSVELAAALSSLRRKRRRAMPTFATPAWAPRVAVAALLVALIGGAAYWMRTPAAAKALAQGRAAVARSLERLDALNPATLLARERTARAPELVRAEARGSAEPGAAAQDSSSGRAAATAQRSAATVKVDGATMAPVAQSSQPIGTARTRYEPPAPAHSPRFDPNPNSALPAIPQPALGRRDPELTRWSPAPSFRTGVAPIEGDDQAPSRLMTAQAAFGPTDASPSADDPAVLRTIRTVVRTSNSWLDRLLAGRSYVKAQAYAHAFDEFQVCHLPRDAGAGGRPASR